MALMMIERVICDVKQTCALEDFVGDPEDAASVVDEQIGRSSFDIRFGSEKFKEGRAIWDKIIIFFQTFQTYNRIIKVTLFIRNLLYDICQSFQDKLFTRL